MKKIILLFTSVILLSCSSSDDGISSNSDFNPPTWIQGVWMQNGSTAATGVGFRFGSDDLCVLISPSSEQCQKGLVAVARSSGGNATVVETITSTTYSAKITYTNGQAVTYSFIKLSDTEIEWSGASGIIFIKE